MFVSVQVLDQSGECINTLDFRAVPEIGDLLRLKQGGPLYEVTGRQLDAVDQAGMGFGGSVKVWVKLHQPNQQQSDYDKGYQDGLAIAKSGDVGGSFFGVGKSEDYMKGFNAGLSAGQAQVIPGSR